MKNERYLKKLWQATQHGKRLEGDPKQTWKEGIRNKMCAE